MRIATKWMFDQGVDAMNRQQSQLVRTQQQLSTGRRFLAAGDDPVAASEAIRTQHALEINHQHARNLEAAAARLRIEESALSGITDIYSQIRTLLVQAGNATYNDQDRQGMAIALRSHMEQLMALANTTDGVGNYLFAGNRDNVIPFTPDASGAVYNGDQGQRLLQVSPSRQLAVSDNGADLFERVMSGNGVFAVSASSTNSGTGTFGPGTVSDPSALTGHAYRLTFTKGVAGTTYDVIDATSGTTISAGNVYASATEISLAGMRLTIQGAPATGDRFEITPSKGGSVFSVVSNAITHLEQGAGTPTARAGMAMGISASISGIDQAAIRASDIHAAVGLRLAEIESLTATGTDIAYFHEQQLSTLQGVDYAKAASDLAQSQAALAAAQQSYAMITRLTLFDFL